MVNVGLVLLCCLGIAAAGEEPLTHDHFQPQWNQGHLTTVCIQVRGPHGPELCGPIVPPPDSKDHPEMGASRNTDIVGSSGLIQPDQFRSAQGGWVGPQPQPNSAPLRSAVLQGFIGNGAVYQMEPGRAVETLPPLVRVNQFSPPQMALVRAPEPHSQPQGPCLEHGMRLAGPQQQVMMAPPPEMAPPHFLNPAPQLRTFPFAPFGIEQQQGPPTYQMRQAVGLRASNPSFMPAMRSADCLDNLQQPGGGGSPMRASSSSFESAQQQQDVKVLTKQCEEQEQEIKKKKEEIGELKKQLERISSRSSSSTSYEQKAVSTKSEQEHPVDKDVKIVDGSKSNSDFLEKKKKK